MGSSSKIHTFLALALVVLASPTAALSADPLSIEAQIAAAAERAKKNADVYYDEIFDSDGRIRPQYRDVYPLYLQKSTAELAAIRRGTTKDFRGDNALSAMPRLATEKEFAEVRRGVAQRGEALLRFLQDHYSGEKKYIKDEVIPEPVIRQIIERAGEADFAGKIDPALIRFMYGPDIIRDAQGVNRVLEDNTAFLGGQGDLILAKESLLKHMPEYRAALNAGSTVDPASFYRDLLARYRSEMKNPAEKIVVFAIPPYPDKEDYRLREIWRNLGVEWVTPRGGAKKLVKKPDGIYLESREGKKVKTEKVGYVIFNTEFQYADATYGPARNQWLLKEATEQLSYKGKEALPKTVRTGLERALQPDPKTGQVDFGKIESILRQHSPYDFELAKRQTPGLIEAITSGQVLSNNTPGTEFINDKEFNMYVEDLIRYYLKEEPILKNLPTRRLYTTDGSGQRIVDEKVFRELEENFGKYVVKTVDGRGGDGVWVGPKLSPEHRKELLERLRNDLSREIIVQNYTHPSVLSGDIVDLRVLSQVGYGGPDGTGHAKVYVPEIGWSRAVSMEGDGKVNLSAGSAHEVTFLVRKGELPGPRRLRNDCPSFFHGL